VPQWHKQLLLFKFQRIRCTICSASPDTKKTIPAGRGHAVAFCRSCHASHQKPQLQREKGVSDCSARLSSGRSEDSRRHWDSRVRKKSQKRLKNEKADCFALRKGITSLTCANSVVKSVQILPEKGCLKWLQGTMSESPWKSH
jgi:predicted metal-binding protein